MKKLYTLIFVLSLAGCQSNDYYSPQVVDATSGSGSAYYGGSTYKALVTQTQALEQSSQSYASTPVSTSTSGDYYTVVRGDTLYSIAFRYGKDYKSLASLNGIVEPYNIEVGQRINLKGASDRGTVTTSPESVSKSVTQSSIYTVQKGDSARSIARNHNMSLEDLVSQNNLQKPYNIYVGQKLRVNGQATYTATTASNQAQVPVAGNNSAKNQQPTKATTTVVSGRTRTVAGISWMWPTKGKVVKRYSSAEHGNNGIDIAGSRGQQIYAAAAGQVVYAGNALRGYGNLIIINHENEYLSAYAHNESLLVKEGQTVKRGQVIAKMGNTDASSVKLHFEIRNKGDSVNPENYLPK